jgi:hypothetical protein
MFTLATMSARSSVAAKDDGRDLARIRGICHLRSQLSPLVSQELGKSYFRRGRLPS